MPTRDPTTIYATTRTNAFMADEQMTELQTSIMSHYTCSAEVAAQVATILATYKKNNTASDRVTDASIKQLVDAIQVGHRYRDVITTYTKNKRIPERFISKRQ